MRLYGVHGEEPPEASEVIKNLVEKSMENCNFWKLHELLENLFC